MDGILLYIDMNRYFNSKIYGMFEINVEPYYYSGSTTKTLQKRLWNHKNKHVNQNPDQKGYKYFSSINWGVDINLIAEYDFNTKDNIIKLCLHDPKCLNMKRKLTTKDEKYEISKQEYIENR